jgi:hypothetical protein
MIDDLNKAVFKKIEQEVYRLTSTFRQSPFQDKTDQEGVRSSSIYDNQKEMQSLLDNKASKNSYESCMNYIIVLHN